MKWVQKVSLPSFSPWVGELVIFHGGPWTASWQRGRRAPESSRPGEEGDAYSRQCWQQCPSALKRPWTTGRGHWVRKELGIWNGCGISNKQRKAAEKKPLHAQEANYLAAELTAQETEDHTAGENLVMPVKSPWVKCQGKMQREESECFHSRRIQWVPASAPRHLRLKRFA